MAEKREVSVHHYGEHFPETPSGLVPVDIGKGCCLLLTREEFAAGVKRGKTWRRQVAREKRRPHGRRDDE